VGDLVPPLPTQLKASQLLLRTLEAPLRLLLALSQPGLLSEQVMAKPQPAAELLPDRWND